MPVFRTQYQSHDRVLQEPGSGDKVLYSPYYDEDGRLELEVSGKENLYEYIQSHAPGVDIHVILSRFAETGDVTLLNRVQGLSIDATTMPKTYAEALNAMISAETYFKGLPVEVRAKFDHSFEQFLAAMDKPGFLGKLGILSEAEQQVSAASGSAESASPASPAQDAPTGA